MRKFLGESAPNIACIGTSHILALVDDLQRQSYQSQGHFTALLCWCGRAKDLHDGGNLNSLSGSQVEGTHLALFLEDGLIRAEAGASALKVLGGTENHSPSTVDFS